jgi:hypothetical protein
MKIFLFNKPKHRKLCIIRNLKPPSIIKIIKMNN